MMRRNYTAMAALSESSYSSGLGGHYNPPGGGGEGGGLSGLSNMAGKRMDGVDSPLRRNTSASTLMELRRREQSDMRHGQPDAALQGSRAAVVEAVACKMLEYILGNDVAHAVMKAHIEASAASSDGTGSASVTPSSSRNASRDDGHAAEAAAAVEAAAAAAAVPETSRSEGADGANPLLAGVPPGISHSLQAYIVTIVRHLELPNSCIVAALIYVQRAVSGTRFKLSVTNWQPCLLAAFVIAAKLSFDEPVWNEDFVKALRISNVQVGQISRWEADFLQLLSYNTNVTVSQYAACCFNLQKSHEVLHGKQCRFFTYLMSLSGPSPVAGRLDDR